MNNMDLNTLSLNVRDWADNKGLLKKENSAKQMLKVTEEIGEVASAIARSSAVGGGGVFVFS